MKSAKLHKEEMTSEQRGKVPLKGIVKEREKQHTQRERSFQTNQNVEGRGS